MNIVKKYFSIFVMIFSISMVVIQPTTSFSTNEGYVPHDISTQGLFMEYPETWVALDADEIPEPFIAMFVLEDSDTVKARINVMNIPVDDKINSHQASEELVDAWGDIFSNLRVENSGKIEIDDYDSWQQIVSVSDNSQNLTQDLIATSLGNNVYIFYLTTLSSDYSKYQEDYNDFLRSIEITPETIPQVIDSVYDDGKIKIQFPNDWISMKFSQYDDEREFLIPASMSFSPSIINGGIENIAAVVLVEFENKAMVSDSIFEISQENNCRITDNAFSIIELNQMKALKLGMMCIPDGYEEEVRAVGYMVITEENSFVVMYMASEQQYLLNLDKFEKSLETAHVPDSINLSNYSEIASVYGMKTVQNTLKINDDLSLPIFLYDDSAITNTQIEVENSQISFQPILNSDKFFQIDIEISEFLEEPYSVDFEGGDAEFYIIKDETVDRMHMSILTENDIEKITIKGQINENLAEMNQKESTSPPLPAWIKGNAEFWANDQIDDATFISGIQFLIKNGIINVPVTTETNASQSNEIPTWIKGNAEFWAQGLISDDDFLMGIEYLVKHGIIKV